jgi:hypothetical protein
LRLSRVSHSLVSFEMVMVVLSCVFVICHSSCAALAINASTCDTVYLYLVAGCLNGLLQKKCGSSLRVSDIIALRVKPCLCADSRCSGSRIEHLSNRLPDHVHGREAPSRYDL